MDERLARHIGKGAREARTRMRLTQADVAERLGMANEVYGRLERGLMLPSVPTLRKLCVALGVSSDALLDLGNADASDALPLPPAFGESPEVRRLLRRVRGLDRRKMRLVILFAVALARSG